MSIPVISIPILNRGDLLLRLFDSIGNYPIDKFVIINNGNYSDVDNAINTLKNKFQNKLDVIKPGENWGCSKSWNYTIKEYMKDYVIICANDVLFNEGDLEKIESWMEKDKRDHLNKLGTINFTNVGYGFFAINRTMVERIGNFDENFYPAYYEDMDYNYRIKIAGNTVSMRDIPEIKMIHGDPNPDIAIDYESCTIHSNAELKACNDITFWINRQYYMNKWGGDRGKERWKYPFNDPLQIYTEWRIIPEYRRQLNIWNKVIFKENK